MYLRNLNYVLAFTVLIFWLAVAPSVVAGDYAVARENGTFQIAGNLNLRNSAVMAAGDYEAQGVMLAAGTDNPAEPVFRDGLARIIVRISIPEFESLSQASASYAGPPLDGEDAEKQRKTMYDADEALIGLSLGPPAMWWPDCRIKPIASPAVIGPCH